MDGLRSGTRITKNPGLAPASSNESNMGKSEKMLRIRHGSEEGYWEWMEKEYPSYEDSNESPDHVWAILHRECSGASMSVTFKEAEKLLESITYHAAPHSWDLATSAEKACWRGYKRRILKAMKGVTEVKPKASSDV